jgi:hypothetical protein
VQVTKALALEWRYKIRVNAIAPGYIDRDQPGFFATEAGQAVKRILRRIGSLSDLDGALLLLVSMRQLHDRKRRRRGRRPGGELPVKGWQRCRFACAAPSPTGRSTACQAACLAQGLVQDFARTCNYDPEKGTVPAFVARQSPPSAPEPVLTD